jgi:hypothetical protein
MAEHPYDELGRRLLASVISYRLGYAGVDRTLKEKVPETVDSSWSELGEYLDREISEAIGRTLSPSIKKLTDLIQ